MHVQTQTPTNDIPIAMTMIRINPFTSEGQLQNHPELYLVAQANAGALGAGQVNLPIVERIAVGGLVKGQIVRFYNLNPAGSGSGAFWIELYNRGDAYEFEYQVVRDFVRSERINRVDRHNDLCHAQEISKGT